MDSTSWREPWVDWADRNIGREVPIAKLITHMTDKGFSQENSFSIIDDACKRRRNYPHLQERVLPNFHSISQFLHEGEVQSIRQKVSLLRYERGKISGGVHDSRLRSNLVGWLSIDNLPEINKVHMAVRQINDSRFGFTLDMRPPTVQVALYRSGHHYAYHVDLGRGVSAFRKLTAIVQLSSPEEYTGGDLELFYRDRPKVMPRELGSLIVFPSFVLHRIAPITGGSRISLTFWENGPPFT